jgi:hypothetical protein
VPLSKSSGAVSQLKVESGHIDLDHLDHPDFRFPGKNVDPGAV